MAKKKGLLHDTGIPEIATGVGILALLASQKKAKAAKELEANRYTYKDPFQFPPVNTFCGGSLRSNGILDDETLYDFLDEHNKVFPKILAEDMQKALIEDTNLDIKVTNVYISSRIIRIVVECMSAADMKALLKMRDDFAIIADSNDVEMARNGNKVYIDIPCEGLPVREADLFEDKAFREAEGTPLAIGQTVDGKVFVVNLEKLPHLLIAGATGSGKSVLMHALILSVLMKNGPKDVELYMIDPKITEFQPYGRLGYCHTVGDAGQAVDLLRKLCDEMDARYAKFAAAGVVELNAYNQKCPQNTMPRKIVFIDELADLMSSVWKKTVEMYIARLSAKARAAGIHLVIATQYPTVKVITGQIKANITARISLNVATRTNSMVILDRTGAEKLQKHGDLLFMNGTDPIRMQAPMVDRWEIENAIDALAQNQIDKTETKTAGSTKKSNRAIKAILIAAAVVSVFCTVKYGIHSDKATNKVDMAATAQRISEQSGRSYSEVYNALNSGYTEEELILSYQNDDAEAAFLEAHDAMVEAHYAEYLREGEENALELERDREAEAQRRAEMEAERQAKQAESDAKWERWRADQEALYGDTPTIDYEEAIELLTAPNPYVEKDNAEIAEQQRIAAQEAQEQVSNGQTEVYSTGATNATNNPVSPVINGSGFNEIRVGEQYRGDVYYNVDQRGYRMDNYDEFYYVNEH